MTDNKQYDWKLCFTDGKNGHSLWLDRITNRYSIKDQSGSRPNNTDDGVLWFYGVVASVHTCKFSKDGLTVAFSVESERDGRSSAVWCVFDFGIRVAKELGMEIVLNEQLKKLEPLFCLTSSKGLSNELNR
jgi:hypothetical protein